MELNDLLADIDGIGGDYYLPSSSQPPTPTPPELPAPAETLPAAQAAGASLLTDTLDLVLDAEMPLLVELGTAQLPLQDVLALPSGGTFALEAEAGAPLRIFIEDQCIGTGEALLIGDRLAIRVVELYATGR